MTFDRFFPFWIFYSVFHRINNSWLLRDSLMYIYFCLLFFCEQQVVSFPIPNLLVTAFFFKNNFLWSRGEKNLFRTPHHISIVHRLTDARIHENKFIRKNKKKNFFFESFLMINYPNSPFFSLFSAFGCGRKNGISRSICFCIYRDLS